jgi:hypothetical protein
MTKESELWEEYIAGAIIVLTIYPIAKDVLNSSPHTNGAFIASVAIALLFVLAGQHIIKKQLKKS